MFETKTEIRRQARIKALVKARANEREKVFRQVREGLREKGIELSPEDEIAIFGRIIPPRRRFSWLPWSRG